MKRSAPVRWLLAAGLALTAAQASAHSMDSAQWRLTQRDATTWDSRLRLPEDLEGRLLSLQTQGPEGCERQGELQLQPAHEASIFVWRLHCPQGLRGVLGLSGFSAQLPDAVLVVESLDRPAQHAVLSLAAPQWSLQDTVPAPLAHYLPLGVAHLLLGPDHLLFVLGLWALWQRSGARPARLVGTLTAFTAAHSITLGGAVLGGWQLPGAVVEACIAASILLLAVELASDTQGAAARHPATMAFAFGLLHGFGFAGALADTGLPEEAQLLALAAFNIGIELGQIAVVLTLIALARLMQPALRWAPAALAIYGAVAAYWTIDRSMEVFA